MIFIGMDVMETAKNMLDREKEKICNGMSKYESNAYDLGVRNTISTLTALVEEDNPVVHIPGQEVSEEFTKTELEEKFPLAVH